MTDISLPPKSHDGVPRRGFLLPLVPLFKLNTDERRWEMKAPIK